MSKLNRIGQLMVEEILPTGTTADSNPYDYGKNEAKRTEIKLYTQTELDKAVKAEREVCAVLCDDLSIKHWDMYKGRGTEKPNNIGRADPHYQGLSDGEELCAIAIRARIK